MLVWIISTATVLFLICCFGKKDSKWNRKSLMLCVLAGAVLAAVLSVVSSRKTEPVQVQEPTAETQSLPNIEAPEQTEELRDYVTPQMFPGESDGIRLESAIRFGVENGVGVYVPEGNYTVHGSYLIDGGGKRLEIRFDPCAYIVFDYDDGYNFRFQDFSGVSISGGSLSRRGTLSQCLESSGIFSFRNVGSTAVSDVFVGESLSGAAFVFGKGCQEVFADRCFFKTIGNGGLISKNSDGMCMRVRDCTFIDFRVKDESFWYCYPVAITYSSYKQQKQIGQSLIVENCIFEDCQWEGPDSHGVQYMELRNCVMHNCARFFMDYMDGRVLSEPYDHELVVDNCVMYNDEDFTFPDYRGQVGCSFSIYGQLGRTMDRVSISNCVIRNPLSKSSGSCGYISAVDSLNLENTRFEAGNLGRNCYALQLDYLRDGRINGCIFVDFAKKTGIIRTSYTQLAVQNSGFYLAPSQKAAINRVRMSAVDGSGNYGGDVFGSASGNMVRSGQGIVSGTGDTVLGYVSEQYAGWKPFDRCPETGISRIVGTVDAAANSIWYQADEILGAYAPLLIDSVVQILYDDGTQQSNRLLDVRYTYGHATQLAILDGVRTYNQVELVFADPLQGEGTVTLDVVDYVNSRSLSAVR